MSTIFWEISKRNIRIHMLRSTLAMLGIIIGVVAIGAMGILGNSMTQEISSSLSSVGDSGNCHPVQRGRWRGDGRWWRRKLSKLNAHRPELPADQTCRRPERGDSRTFNIRTHESGCRKRRHCGDHLRAPDQDQTKDLLPELEAGDYNNGNSGCLVGSTFAKDHNVKVGSRISIGSDGKYGALRVTGIIKERGMSFDISTDSALVVTKDWFENTYNEQNEYNEVVVKVTSGNTADVTTTIENQLNRNTRDKTVSVTDSKATLSSIYATFSTVTTFVEAIGGISMIVAGVSIFNIMMMSVNERIKEIGIMRSIGTQKKEVMSMFIYEAAIIGVTGSLIGGSLCILAGYAISALMLKTTEYLFTVASMMSVVEGVGFGIVICILCGVYPAWQAANLNPIDALRHE